MCPFEASVRKMVREIRQELKARRQTTSLKAVVEPRVPILLLCKSPLLLETLTPTVTGSGMLSVTMDDLQLLIRYSNAPSPDLQTCSLSIRFSSIRVLHPYRRTLTIGRVSIRNANVSNYFINFFFIFVQRRRSREQNFFLSIFNTVNVYFFWNI